MKNGALALTGVALGLCCRLAPGASLAAHVTDESGQPVADAVVVAVPVGGTVNLPQKRPVATLEQVDMEFVPRVTAILVGSEVAFPNRDHVRHHVYSFSPAKRFDFPLYIGTPAKPVTFDQPGLVVIGCNIHDWMIGYIYVSESPYFAKTDNRGSVSLTDLPPRTYVARVWHARMKATEESTQKTVDATAGPADIEWVLRLKPDVRVRRAPVHGGGSRY